MPGRKVRGEGCIKSAIERLFEIGERNPALMNSYFGTGARAIDGEKCLRAIRFKAELPGVTVRAELCCGPSFALGVRYALGGLFLSGLPWLALTREFRTTQLSILAPLTAHVLALVLAGGDWMPLHRLWVPLGPWLVWSSFSTPGSNRIREGVGIGLSVSCFLLQLVAFGADSRAVVERRETWIAQGERLLAGAQVVATVDIGWVGQAFPGRVVDLAGVTDPRVAGLPGGHTSKRISAGFFAGRDVDAWVVRAINRNFRVGDPLDEIVAQYEVDHRLIRRAVDLGFQAAGVIPIEGTPGQYVILRAQKEAVVRP